MGYVTALAVDEPVRVDARRVGDIVNELGQVAAQNVIGMALEQLAGALAAIDDAILRDDMADTVLNADRLSRLAWQVGLTSLSGVAVDLGACAERRDLGALAAVRARLMRVGNRSLTQIWESADFG